jgi:ribulose 1,5-bisphosphate synthetase/thiazole synthase
MAHIIVVGAGAGGVPCAYELGKVRTGSVTPVYEKYVLKLLGIVSLKHGRG